MNTDKQPTKNRRDSAKQEKAIRDTKTERELDKTIDDSFPASDAPAHY